MWLAANRPSSRLIGTYIALLRVLNSTPEHQCANISLRHSQRTELPSHPIEVLSARRWVRAFHATLSWRLTVIVYDDRNELPGTLVAVA